MEEEDAPTVASELVGFSLQKASPTRQTNQMPADVIEEIKKKISSIDPPLISAENDFGPQTEMDDVPSINVAAPTDVAESQEDIPATAQDEPVDLRAKGVTVPALIMPSSSPSLKLKPVTVEGNMDDLLGTAPPDYEGIHSASDPDRDRLKIDEGLSLSRRSAASPSARVDDIRVLMKDFEEAGIEPKVVEQELPKVEDNGSATARRPDRSADGIKSASEVDSVLYAALAFPEDGAAKDGSTGNGLERKKSTASDFDPRVACRVASLLSACCGTWKPLHRAAQSGSVALATALLDAGADVECQNPGGGRPLHVASQRGKDKVARLLIARKANVEAKDKSGWRPLHFAVGNSHPEVAAILIDGGASLEWGGGKKGVRAIHMAVESGNVRMVALLRERGASLEGESLSGLKPLHLAAQSGNLGMTRALLDHGALVNGEDKSGVRPLYLAAHDGHTEVVRLLLQRGANPDHVTAKGMTPLLTAAMRETHLDVAALLITEGGVSVETALPPFLLRPLHLACAHGHRRMALLLLSHGASVEPRARNGATPLHLAATQGRAEVAEMLLDRGARVDSHDSSIRTPLHAACAAGEEEVVEVLLRHGAALESRSADNRTPLDMAMANAHVDVLMKLLERGALLSSPAKSMESKKFLSRIIDTFRA